MAWYSVLSDIVKPITEMVDNLNTSDEERLQIKAKMYELQTKMGSEMLNYESQLAKSRSDIILAETQGQSWIQRNWRPVTMLTFLVLVACDSFGLLAFRLADQAWTLLQLGLGGYVVGRSAEKIVPKVIDGIKNKG